MICDAHCDTLFRMMEGKHNSLDITLDRLRQGGVTLQVFAMFVGNDNRLDIVQAQNSAMLEQLEVLKAQGLRHIKNLDDLCDDQVNGMLSLEGCECITDEKALDYYTEKGVRMAAVTWNFENDFAYPACLNKDRGLKPFGKEMVVEMQKRKIAIDVSHLNEAGFYDLIEYFDKPVLASHSNVARLCAHSRNLTDDQLKALFQKGGYVGINFWPNFLSPAHNVDLDTVIDHILYMMDLGGSGMVGFGSDFDGISTKPSGLENPLGFPRLIQRMYERGLTQNEVEGIAGKNLIAYFQRL